MQIVIQSLVVQSSVVVTKVTADIIARKTRNKTMKMVVLAVKVHPRLVGSLAAKHAESLSQPAAE